MFEDDGRELTPSNHPDETCHAIVPVGMPQDVEYDSYFLDQAVFDSISYLRTKPKKLSFIDKNIIEEAHAYGMKVYVFSVNKPEEALIMKTLGIDGIFTDYPDLFQNCR